MNPNIHTCCITTYYLLSRRDVFQKEISGICTDIGYSKL
jgi:hypothetical protein